jgi:hypothetical protein
VLSTSLPFSNSATVAGVEARDMLLQLKAQAKDKLAALRPRATAP